MRAAAVFNLLPDLLFYWSDEAFVRHVKETAVQDNVNVEFNDETMINLVNEFFVPLVPSFHLMQQSGEEYTTIVCEDGTIYAMREFDGLFMVAVCSDKMESEWFLHRKLAFLGQLFRQQCGPCLDLVKPQGTLARQRMWARLCTLFETWQELCGQEQIFLVEALERLHVNQTLNSNCLGLLEDVLSKANKDITALHSLILVNNKLLGLYSSKYAPELHVADILMLTVFSKAHYKYHDHMVPTSVYRTPPALSVDGMTLKSDQSLFEGIAERCHSEPISVPNSATKTSPSVPTSKESTGLDSSPGTEFHSADSTPQTQTGESYLEAVMQLGENYYTPLSGSPVSSSTFSDPTSRLSQHRDDVNASKEDDVSSEEVNGSTSTSSSIQSATKGRAASSIPTQHSNDEAVGFYYQQTMCLRTPMSPYTPHTIHFIQLDDFTVLILIFQFRHGGLTSLVHRGLLMLTSILSFLEENDDDISTFSVRHAKTAETLDFILKRLIDGLLAATELHSEQLKMAVRSVETHWTIVRKAIPRSPAGQEGLSVTSSRLSQVILELIKALKSVFAVIYLNWKPRRTPRYDRHMRTIELIRELALRRLRDFSSYLQVRGHRNVTMTAYHNDFPGLVHFIYINRSTDLVIAPSINGSESDSSVAPIRQIIKQRIWDFWQYSQFHMTRGYTTLIIRDGDFIFSYYLWFEDALGKPLPMPRSVNRDQEDAPITASIGDDFYRRLTKRYFPTLSRDSVCCFEMICVHVGIVSNRYVVTSCKRLAELLWEASGEANSPIGLL